MTVRSSRMTVTTAATDLTVIDTDFTFGSSIDVLNLGAAAIYLGGADVTAAQGRPVDAGGSYACDLLSGEKLYAVAAAGTVEVSVLRTGV